MLLSTLLRPVEVPYSGERGKIKYQGRKQHTMPRKGSKHPYKPRKEYSYTTKDIADLGGMTRNALNVAKAHGKVDPGDLKSVVSFLTRRIIDKHLNGDLFARAPRTGKSADKGTGGNRVSRRRTKKTAGRR